jgi:hypothetical protein
MSAPLEKPGFREVPPGGATFNWTGDEIPFIDVKSGF